MRDAEGKVQSLTAELRGLRQAQGGQAEAKLKQQLTELEVRRAGTWLALAGGAHAAEGAL